MNDTYCRPVTLMGMTFFSLHYLIKNHLSLSLISIQEHYMNGCYVAEMQLEFCAVLVYIELGVISKLSFMAYDI